MWSKKYLRRAALCLDLLNRTVSVKRNGQRKSQRSISSFRVEETFYLIFMFSASQSSFYNIPPLGPQTELHWWGKTTLAKRRDSRAILAASRGVAWARWAVETMHSVTLELHGWLKKSRKIREYLLNRDPKSISFLQSNHFKWSFFCP